MPSLPHEAIIAPCTVSTVLQLRHILLICLAAYTLPSLGGAFPSDKASPDTNPSQETATAAMDLLEDAEADDGGLPDKTGAPRII